MREQDFLSLWLGYSIITFILCILLAFSHEKTRKKANPNTKPYRWGYYCGFMCLANGLPLAFLGLYAMFSTAEGGEEVLIAGGMLVFGSIHLVTGWYITKRKRWAWIISIPFQLNCFMWVANTIYLANRWGEMRDEQVATTNPVQALPRNLPHMDELFLLSVQGQQRGPYTLGQIRSMWDTGIITADSRYRTQTQSAWYNLVDLINGKKPHADKPPPKAQQPRAMPPPTVLYMVDDNGQKHGPYTRKELRKHYDASAFSADALVAVQGSSDWHDLSAKIVSIS